MCSLVFVKAFVGHMTPKGPLRVPQWKILSTFSHVFSQMHHLITELNHTEEKLHARPIGITHTHKYLSVCVCERHCMPVCLLYIYVCVCVCVQGNKRAERCDMVPCVSVNNPTLVIGIEY